MPCPPCEPVGMPEIAERLGVSKSAVLRWRQRDLGFPEPRWTVMERYPLWEMSEVDAWARERKLGCYNPRHD